MARKRKTQKLSRREQEVLWAQRRDKVARLFLQRFTERQIAAALGISPALAHRDLARIMAEWRERAVLSLEGRKLKELEALDQEDRDLRADLARMAQDDFRNRLKAREVILKIHDRRVALLGLETVSINVSGSLGLVDRPTSERDQEAERVRVAEAILASRRPWTEN